MLCLGQGLQQKCKYQCAVALWVLVGVMKDTFLFAVLKSADAHVRARWPRSLVCDVIDVALALISS